MTLAPPDGAGKPIQARAKAPAGTEWVVVFLRKEGETEFETLTLEPGENGTYALDFVAQQGAGTKFQYYGAMHGPDGVKTLPANAPAAVLSLALPGTAAPQALPPAAPKPHGPVYVDGSFTDIVHRKTEIPGEPTFMAAGQVRYALQKDEGNGHLFLGTRLVYTNLPAPNQAQWSIGDIQASYASGDHRIQAGDFMTQESEFTLGGGGRRGLDYTWSGKPMGAHLFAVTTERQTGFKGLMWPVDGSDAYGGSLSRAWFGTALRTRIIFLTGQDDPSTAANASTAFAAPVREGSTGSLVVDGRFLQNRLGVSGEYARSLFTRDARTGEAKESDQAWRLSTQWSQGSFSGQVGYRDVGRDFGTVGVSFFVGDRRVLDGSVGVNHATWGLTASATDERTNPTGQVNLNQAWNQTQSLDARFLVAPGAFWRVGLRASRQAAEVVANPLIPFSDSKRAGVTTGFDLTLPPHVMLTFNAQFDHITSTGAFASSGTSATLSLGGMLTLSDWGRLGPNLSWSRVLSQPGDQLTVVTNAFLNGEFRLIPRTLAFLLNGGVSRTELYTGTAMTSSTAEGTFAWTLDRYLKGKGRGNLGLKGRYTHNPVLIGFSDDNRVFLLLNISY